MLKLRNLFLIISYKSIHVYIFSFKMRATGHLLATEVAVLAYWPLFGVR